MNNESIIADWMGNAATLDSEAEASRADRLIWAANQKRRHALGKKAAWNDEADAVVRHNVENGDRIFWIVTIYQVDFTSTRA